MVQYHLRPDDNVPARCAEDKPCPLGPDTAHYSDRDQAFHAMHELEQAAEPKAFTVRVQNLPRGVVKDGVATLPPGTYWLGDPCYAAGQLDAEWERWVDLAGAASHNFSDPVAGARFGEWPVVAANTLYGDGSYPGSNGVAFAVDSGCIGVTPKGLIEELKLDLDKLDAFGAWISVAEPTHLTVDEEGTITFGPVSIFTGGDSA